MIRSQPVRFRLPPKHFLLPCKQEKYSKGGGRCAGALHKGNISSISSTSVEEDSLFSHPSFPKKQRGRVDRSSLHTAAAHTAFSFLFSRLNFSETLFYPCGRFHPNTYYTRREILTTSPKPFPRREDMWPHLTHPLPHHFQHMLARSSNIITHIKTARRFVSFSYDISPVSPQKPTAKKKRGIYQTRGYSVDFILSNHMIRTSILFLHPSRRAVRREKKKNLCGGGGGSDTSFHYLPPKRSFDRSHSSNRSKKSPRSSSGNPTGQITKSTTEQDEQEHTRGGTTPRSYLCSVDGRLVVGKHPTF